MTERDVDLADDELAVVALFARCKGIPMPELLEARVARTAASSGDSGEVRPLARLFDAHRDDGWSFVLASVRDADLARGALEDAFARLSPRVERGEDLALPEVLAAAREATSGVWLHLRKTGHADDHPLGALDDDARDLLLLRGLGLGLDDLRRARALSKAATPAEGRAALAAAADAMVVTLPLPAHAGAGEQARRVARAALGRDDDLDLVSASERASADAHVTTCAACAVLRERLLSAVTVELRVCPAADEVLAAVEERVAKDAAHRVAVASITARISLSCSFCHAPMVRAEAAFCAACLAPHHEDCFRDHGRCSAPGCGEQAVVRPGVDDARPRRTRRAWLALGLTGLVGAAALAGGGLALRAAGASLEARQLEEDRARRRAVELDARLGSSRETINELAAKYEATKKELARAQDQQLELTRQFDEERRRLAGQLDELQAARTPEERAAVVARQRAAASQEAADDAARLDALWTDLQALARERGAKPEDLLAEARQSAEARLEGEIEAVFAEIKRLAEAREVDRLIESFARLRELMKQAEALPKVREKLAGWNARLQDLGEVQLSITLQMHIAEGNQALRSLVEATATEDWEGAEAAFAAVELVVAEMRAQGREVFHRNAEALALRADAVIRRARVLRRAAALVLVVEALDLAAAGGPRVTIAGRTYGEGDALDGTEPPITIVKIASGALTLRVDEVELVRAFTPPADAPR